MNKINPNRPIFKKMGVSERKRLFREIAMAHGQLTVRLSEDKMVNLAVHCIEKEESLVAKSVDGLLALEKPQQVIVNFEIDSEKYFFYPLLFMSGDLFFMRMDEDLFQLQRRMSVRIDVPSDYDCDFILTQHAEERYLAKCRILDISAGGLKIELPEEAPVLRFTDQIRGQLRLGARRPIDFELEVRFVKKLAPEEIVIKDQFTPLFTAGLKFLNIDSGMENRILGLMLDIQKDLYKKSLKDG